MLEKDIIRKIQKALALANGNANDNESQTAMLLAQRLMAENNVTMSQINVAEDKPKNADTVRTEYKKRMDWWLPKLANVIADNFKCFTYLSIYKGLGTKIVFLGLETDTKIALEVFNYAVEMIKHHSTSYIRQNGGINRSDTTAIKNDYIRGYIKGLEDKFKEQVQSLALVVVKDQVVVKAYNRLKLGKSQARAVSSSNNQTAYANGYKTGKAFNDSKQIG